MLQCKCKCRPLQVGFEIMWPVHLISSFTVGLTSVSSSLSALLPNVWLLFIFNLMSLVHGGEYMTVSRSSAIVNITYHNPLTDSLYSEVGIYSELL